MSQESDLERLVRIETKLDLHFQNIESWKAEVEQTNADYEGRLRSLERWKYSIPATLITAAVSLYLSAWK